jgi:hypothetical protein
LSICFVLALGFSSSGFAQEQKKKNSMAHVKTGFTCEEATKLKFDEAKYRQLKIDDRVILDARWNQCDLEKNPKSGRVAVVVTNPAPREGETKIFYGTMKRKDLDNATKNCKQVRRQASV